MKEEINSDFHRMMELPWQKLINAYIPAIPYLTPESIRIKTNNPSYEFSKSMPAFMDKIWPSLQGLTLLDPFRIGWLIDIMNKVRDLKGDIVECGCSKGGTGLMLGFVTKELQINKKIHLLDSFEGLPEPHELLDQGYNKGMFKADYMNLHSKIEEYGIQDIVHVHKGLFRDTIGEVMAKVKSISLLHVDCDLYSSTLECFRPLYPLVEDGGAVVFDDFNDGCKGEKQAALEILGDEKIRMIVGPTPQTFFFKSERAKPTGVNIYKSNNILYDFNTIINENAYFEWLDFQLNENYKEAINKFIIK